MIPKNFSLENDSSIGAIAKVYQKHSTAKIWSNRNTDTNNGSIESFSGSSQHPSYNASTSIDIDIK